MLFLTDFFELGELSSISSKCIVQVNVSSIREHYVHNRASELNRSRCVFDLCHVSICYRYDQGIFSEIKSVGKLLKLKIYVSDLDFF